MMIVGGPPRRIHEEFEGGWDYWHHWRWQRNDGPLYEAWNVAKENLVEQKAFYTSYI